MYYIKTWKEVILRPSNFYNSMQKTGGYTDPLTFAVICIIINTLFTAFARPSILALIGMHNLTSRFPIFSNVIIMLVFSIVSLFVFALILNFFYKLIGGNGNFRGTLRFICYSYAPIVVTWIPIIGLVIGIYELYLCIVGGMIVHNISMKKSTILILPLVILYVFLGVRIILYSFAH